MAIAARKNYIFRSCNTRKTRIDCTLDYPLCAAGICRSLADQSYWVKTAGFVLFSVLYGRHSPRTYIFYST